MARLRSAGLTLAEIGQRFGTSRQAVKVILDRAGCPNPSQPRPVGFAALSAEQRRAIASQGGKAAHATGKAYRFTSEQATAAGRKGGLAKARNARARKKRR